MTDTPEDTAAAPSDSLASYRQQVEGLQEQLKEKTEQMCDLQKGLEAQVTMVMQLEALEQKEWQQYELKIHANRQLISELGERVGDESKRSAELESQLNYQKKLAQDQASQIARLEDLNTMNTQLLQQAKQQQQVDNSNSQQPTPANDNSKLEFMMESNQKLVRELAQAQEYMQNVRREVTDKELLCLELSSQLDKLATQLNTSDEDMAKVKNDLTAKENDLKKAEERIQLLEKSMLEAPQGDDKQGTALLMKHLKEKEEQCQRVLRERDASLSKATKLSLALASSKEHVDALQEKLDYQNSIVDRILGKRHSGNGTAAPTATHVKPKRHSSVDRRTIGRSLSGFQKRDSNASNTSADANNTSSAPFRGQRIRNFFTRGRANSGASTPNTTPTAASAAINGSSPTTTARNNTVNASPAAPDATTTATTPTSAPPAARGGGLFQRKPSADSSSTHSTNINNKTATAQPKTNPFDDDNNATFTNESVGKEDHMEENCQGGGGAVNLALTL